MADLALTGAHTKVAVGADDPTKEINKGEWNGTGAHSIIATMATGFLLGRNTAGAGSPEEITLGTGLAFVGTTLNASGGASLDAITAAVADQAGILNADWNIRWNWKKTTDNEVAFELGESVASTGGTSTLGVPNQVLGKFSTLATSTMSPLSVWESGLHVFSVSPTKQQILAANGAAANPIYGFASDLNTGIYWSSADTFVLVAGGTGTLTISATQALGLSGTAAVPSIGGQTGQDGFFFAVSDLVGVSVGGLENSRFGARFWQPSRGSADANAYAVNARKSRGSVASPTVITTGDDLLTINGYGYVGATNTYQIGGYIRFDSSGTVSDAANGFAKDIFFGTNTATNAATDSVGIMADGTIKLLKNDSTGAGTALLSTNCPAVTATAPYTWMKFTSNDGSAVYVPCWK